MAARLIRASSPCLVCRARLGARVNRQCALRNRDRAYPGCAVALIAL